MACGVLVGADGAVALQDDDGAVSFAELRAAVTEHGLPERRGALGLEP